jgi:Lon protease-like protein
MKADVMELPLFPLDVVLFPGQTLPLHIFEPRYRTMIQRCIEQGQPFGVVLANDVEDSTPHNIGTAARITQVERLEDGRMNILTVGVERFVLQNVYEGEDEYLIGDAVFYPFKDDVKPRNQLIGLVLARLRRYLTLLSEISGTKFRFEHFPNDATAIGVFAAIALQVPLDRKQELLATESTNELLATEAEILKSELIELSVMALSVKPAVENSAERLIFSKN